MVGLPDDPLAVVDASNGEVELTFVNDAAPSLIASVAPVTVTERVFDPVVVAVKYHVSQAIPVLRLVAALVSVPPLNVAEVIEPVPATSCHTAADSTTRSLALAESVIV